MAKGKFLVLGGRYKDTTFTAEAEPLQEYGPFATEQEAYGCWQTLSWQNVDDCLVRYHIVSGD